MKPGCEGDSLFTVYTLFCYVFHAIYFCFRSIFMQPQNEINTPTQFMRIAFGFDFDLFDYLRYDFSSVS